MQNATSAQTQAWANPFDNPIYNSVTNLTSSPGAPSPGNPVTLTATVTSASSRHLDNGSHGVIQPDHVRRVGRWTSHRR